MKRVMVMLMLALLPSMIGMAQEATQPPDAGWTVEQRCVGEPTKAPKGWTYEGIIFFESSEGVHALRADLKTTYIISFSGADFIGSGALSPDGQWFAVPSGHDEYGSMTDSWYIVEKIKIYSTSPSGKFYTVPVGGMYRGGGSYAVSPVRWLDNEHIVYDSGDVAKTKISTINPFSLETQTLHTPFRLLHIALNISPDWTTAVGYFNGQLGVFDISSGELKAELSIASLSSVWKPDSTYFVAEVVEETKTLQKNKLTLFDKQGNTIQDILDFSTDMYLHGVYRAYQEFEPILEWSGDGRYLAFAMTLSPTTNADLFIADMQRHSITDTCLAASDGVAWSPDSQELVLAEGKRIDVFKIAKNQRYTVGNHDGAIIGWRAGE